MMRYLLVSIFFCSSTLLYAQEIKILTSGSNTSIRGLSVVDDRIIWASGSNGTICRSLDSGNTWKWMLIKGFEKTDFRDIEAFDETSALVMGIGEPAYILRTADGGKTWKLVYENKTNGMFLDAMEFWNENSGIVIGDPIDNRFFIARTFDGGMHWKDLPEQNRPVADSGEACFAASGTNIRKLDQAEAVFISGGIRSRLFIRDQRIELPIAWGKITAGANSIAIKNKKTWMIVGGDYIAADTIDKNCCITNDAGKTWMIPAIAPHGYRSCVEYLYNNKWICCGSNGVDYTADDGKSWSWISKEGFHVCRKAKKGKAVFLAGSDGRIGKLYLQ